MVSDRFNVGADLLLAQSKIMKNGRSFVFWNLGGLAKVRYSMIQAGAGYGYAPAFTDEGGSDHAGAGSPLLSAGATFLHHFSRQLLFDVGVENVFFLNQLEKETYAPEPEPVLESLPWQVVKRSPTGDNRPKSPIMPEDRVPDTVAPKPVVLPSLDFRCDVEDANGDKTFAGGERVALAVSVTNSGAGHGHGVAIQLSGTSKALQHLGTSQSIGDIGPGETKEAKFEATLPNRVEADNGNIIVRVTEANGFDALEEKELIVAMQPAKVTRETQVVSTLVDVDAPLEPSGFTREDAYAVVVGISNYRQSALPKVTYARKDAEAMKDYLTSVCGFKEGNIKLLVDDGAALSDLTAYCEEWLGRNVRKGSFVFVYFAGHGTPSPDKGEAYIVPFDGEPGFVSKLYPLSRLYSSLTALPTDHVVVALDACFSGAGGRSVMEQGKRPLVAVDLEKEAQKLGNVAVLAAAAGNEISQDYDAKRHGLFTYYLLKGLRGEADADHDGWVTLGELYNYAKPRVLDESQRLGHEQMIQLLPPGAKAAERVARVR